MMPVMKLWGHKDMFQKAKIPVHIRVYQQGLETHPNNIDIHHHFRKSEDIKRQNNNGAGGNHIKKSDCVTLRASPLSYWNDAPHESPIKKKFYDKHGGRYTERGRQ